jgi:hypothetical protein
MRIQASVPMTPLDRLLGGWRDILDDVARAEERLRSVDEECQCGHASATVDCACCRAAAERARVVCPPCERELLEIAERFDVLQVDTVRFLPLVGLVARRRHTDLTDEKVFLAALGDVLGACRRRLSGLESHRGCVAAHLRPIEHLAAKVRLAAERLDDALHAVANP